MTITPTVLLPNLISERQAARFSFPNKSIAKRLPTSLIWTDLETGRFAHGHFQLSQLFSERRNANHIETFVMEPTAP